MKRAKLRTYEKDYVINRVDKVIDYRRDNRIELAWNEWDVLNDRNKLLVNNDPDPELVLRIAGGIDEWRD